MIKKKSNHYFTQDHEDAIIKYALSSDRAIRTKLYIEFIQPAFDEMVDKIIFTYKFRSMLSPTLIFITNTVISQWAKELEAFNLNILIVSNARDMKKFMAYVKDSSINNYNIIDLEYVIEYDIPKDISS